VDDNEDSRHYLARNWKPVSLITLVGLIPAMIAANSWYVEWHKEYGDGRYVQIEQAEQLYALKGEVPELAQTDKLTAQLAQVDQNVDFLVKSAAVQAVDRIKGEMTLHSFQDDGSASWKRQRDELQRRLANAESYRDCLFRVGSQNCDASRVW